MKIIILTLIFPVTVLAEVNMKDASYYNTWTDFQNESLPLSRTYRSRSLNKGVFGFGWCAAFEIALDLGGERPVLSECGVTLSNVELKKDDNGYTRILDKNSFEKFNNRGQLLQISTAKANFEVHYNSNGRVESLSSASGDRLNFSYQGSRIREASSLSGVHFTYMYDGEDLVFVKTNSEAVYAYKYDFLHNLERVEYLDNTFEAMTYDSDHDWVLTAKSRDNCNESFNYQQNPTSTHKHYVSTVEKICNEKIVYSARYEFWHKTRSDGSSYLGRAKVTFNKNQTEITYHPVTGLPLQISQNGRRIQ